MSNHAEKDDHRLSKEWTRKYFWERLHVHANGDPVKAVEQMLGVSRKRAQQIIKNLKREQETKNAQI